MKAPGTEGRFGDGLDAFAIKRFKDVHRTTDAGLAGNLVNGRVDLRLRAMAILVSFVQLGEVGTKHGRDTLDASKHCPQRHRPHRARAPQHPKPICNTMPRPPPRSTPVVIALLWALRGLLALLPIFGLLACNRDAPEAVAKIWQRVDGRWTFEGNAFEAADAATLVPLDSRFARDSVQGYYRGTPIPGSHGPSLEVLGENEVRDHQTVYWADTYRKGQEYYLIRHNRVETISGADPARYQVLKWGYARDGNHAYREGRRLQGVRDPASFEALTPRLSRDARRAYFEDLEIPESDGASFQIIDVHEDDWVRDRQRAWFVSSGQPEPGEPARRQVQLLKQAQPAALRPLGRQYASDGQHVWWRGRLLQDAQAATFVVIDSDAASAPTKADARDARGLFERGRRLPAGQP